MSVHNYTKPSAKSASLGRWNVQSALDLGPMCDVEEDWHKLSFLASGALNGSSQWNVNEIFCLYFLTTSNALIKAFLLFFGPNSMLFCLLKYHLSIFVISCSNLSEIRVSNAGMSRFSWTSCVPLHLSREHRITPVQILYLLKIISGYSSVSELLSFRPHVCQGFALSLIWAPSELQATHQGTKTFIGIHLPILFRWKSNKLLDIDEKGGSSMRVL